MASRQTCDLMCPCSGRLHAGNQRNGMRPTARTQVNRHGHGMNGAVLDEIETRLEASKPRSRASRAGSFVTMPAVVAAMAQRLVFHRISILREEACDAGQDDLHGTIDIEANDGWVTRSVFRYQISSAYVHRVTVPTD